MNKFLSLLLIYSLNTLAANRPYHEVLKDFVKNNCKQQKENIYLSKNEREQLEEMSKTKLYGGLVLRYITTCPNTPPTYHYVDSHIVRTLNETVILTISQDKLESFIVASFNEPPEYIAPSKWYKQFQGANGEKVLKAREEIDALSGATLTANASINVVNKTLALHKFLQKNKSKN